MASTSSSTGGTAATAAAAAAAGSASAAAGAAAASTPPLPPELAITHNAYDTEAWEQLLARAFTLPVERARPVYERFLSIFPTSARYWRQYIVHEQAAHNYTEVEALFSRCLLPVLSLPLFQTYLDYVRHVKAGADDEADALETAYEFVLQHMALDINSPSVFLAYLQFLAALPTSSPIEEQQKMQKLRKVYQRGVVIPGVGVEDIWREWDKFEHGVNKILAASLLGGEWNQRHLQAKAVGKERKRRMRGLKADFLSTPPTPMNCLMHAQQLLQWRSLLAYERTNPLHLSPIDAHHALVFTFRQALTFLSHHPVMWGDYLQYLQSVSLELGGVTESVEEAWKDARSALPYSLTLSFMHAEWLEEKGRLQDAKKLYEALIDQRKNRSRDVADREEESTHQVNRRISRIQLADPMPEPTSMADEDGRPSGDPSPADDPTGQQRAELKEDEDAAARNLTLLYIQLMRVVRRCEGADAARNVFIQARKCKALTSHAYVFAALMYYHVNKNAEFASKIFLHGLDKYESDDGYVRAYLDFLFMVNDQSNMRVVIERIVKDSEEEGRKHRQREEDDRLKTRGKKKSARGHDADDMDVHAEPLWAFGRPPRPEDDEGMSTGLGGVWARYVELERWTASELSTIGKAEERREVALGLHSPRVAILMDRYRFMDLWPSSSAMRRCIALLLRPDLAFATIGPVAPGVPARVFPTPSIALLTCIDPMHPPPDAALVRRRYPGIGEAALYGLMRLGGAGVDGWAGPLYDVDAVLRGMREKVDEARAGEWVEKGGMEGENVKTEGGKRKREDVDEEKEEQRPAETSAASADLFRQRRANKLVRQQ